MKNVHYFISAGVNVDETYVFVVDDGFVNVFKRVFINVRELFTVWGKISSDPYGLDFGQLLPPVRDFRVLRISSHDDLNKSSALDIIIKHRLSCEA